MIIKTIIIVVIIIKVSSPLLTPAIICNFFSIVVLMMMTIMIITRPVHKNLFLEFPKMQELCYILIEKQILEKVFCSNIAPLLSPRDHLFYKAEYMGQSCLN